jgi:hypothetical protein
MPPAHPNHAQLGETPATRQSARAHWGVSRASPPLLLCHCYCPSKMCYRVLRTTQDCALDWRSQMAKLLQRTPISSHTTHACTRASLETPQGGGGGPSPEAPAVAAPCA